MSEGKKRELLNYMGFRNKVLYERFARVQSLQVINKLNSH